VKQSTLNAVTTPKNFDDIQHEAEALRERLESIVGVNGDSTLLLLNAYYLGQDDCWKVVKKSLQEMADRIVHTP
jgi:hypothetical protein